jgi:hypothetical protein
MPAILGSTSDVSAIATGLNLAVPSGCTWFSLFGKTLTQSLYNYANPAAPVVVANGQTPAVSTTSGISVGGSFSGGNPAVETLVTPVSPLTTSETLMLVAQWTYSQLTNTRAMPIGNATAPNNYALEWSADAGANQFSAVINATNSSGTPYGFAAGIGALNESIHTGAPNTFAIFAVPQVYFATIDVENQLLTFENMSQANGDATWKNSVPFPSGYALRSNSNLTPYVIPQTAQSASSYVTSMTTHAAAQWSRALSAAERLTAYNQVKAILTKRGVNV